MQKIMFMFLLLTTQFTSYAQVKIGSAGNPDAGAVLELDGSNGKGLLLPRLNANQVSALNATNGMIIYNTSDASLYLRKSNAWQKLAEYNNGGGSFSLPYIASQQVDDGYLMDLTNTSFTGINGVIKAHSSTSGYGIYGSSFTGAGGYFTSTTGPSLVTGTGFAGIGTFAPAAKMHVRHTTQDLVQVENSTALGSGVNTKALFKTGSYFTGGIGTTGIAGQASRLSIFSGVVLSPASLQERISVLDNGNVGINKINPVAKLDVAGKLKATAQFGDDAALELTGPIKVVGTNQAAFVLTGTLANLSDGNRALTIDHPHCNNDPNAVLIVTGRDHENFTVKYNNISGRWFLYTNHKESNGYINLMYRDCNNVCKSYSIEMTPEPSYFYAGIKFNVLIFKSQ